MRHKPKYRVYYNNGVWNVCASHDGKRRKPFIVTGTLKGALKKLALRHQRLMQAH